MKQLSKTFRSIKACPIPKASSSTPPPKTTSLNLQSRSSWSVYLIISTNNPIKTYVGVTNNFPRRLKQHNGELRGGAKASLAGRPWICACLVQGFKDRSEACVFESKWKSLSRKLPRKRKNDDANDVSHQLLQHRQLALKSVKGSLDCSCLEFNWQLNLL